MNFDEIVTLLSLIISILAIIAPYLSKKSQLKFEERKEAKKQYLLEMKLCAEFLAYCKKAHTFSITKDEMLYFSQAYIKLHTISHPELKEALLKCFDSIITDSKTSIEDFSNAIRLYQKTYSEKNK